MLVDKAKLFAAAIITIIVLVTIFIICVWAGSLIGISILQSPSTLAAFPLMSVTTGVIVFTSAYIFMNKGIDGFFNTPTNATLTCKNGHTCRVWVQFDGRGRWYDSEKGEYKLHIGGGPAVIPDTCPECGARWEVPHKHGKPITIQHHQ